MNREAERKRLVELVDSARYWGSGTSSEIADRLLDNGIIVPPVKVGDKVYKVLCTNIGAFCGVTNSTCDECPYQNRQVVEGTVLAIKFAKGIQLKVGFNIFTDYFCEDELCYTREQAQKALEGSGDR